MSWTDRWYLCARQDCDVRTLLPREEQERIFARLYAGHMDALKMQELRSVVFLEARGVAAWRVPGDALVEELKHLFRSRRVHLHVREKKYHRPGAYESGLQVMQASTPKKRTEPAVTQADWDTWIAVKLVDDEKKPVPGVRFRIVLPDKSVKEGRLDAEGRARVDSFQSGQCAISFPDLDAQDWHPL